MLLHVPFFLKKKVADFHVAGQEIHGEKTTLNPLYV
jgi:hypothetical protein